jgi:hypothetical protein
MLDRIPAPLRHAIIIFAGAVLTYVTAETTKTDLGIYTPVVATLVSMAGLYVTKLTKQYGIGANDDFADEEDLEDAEK